MVTPNSTGRLGAWSRPKRRELKTEQAPSETHNGVRPGLHIGEITMTANINVELATIAGTNLSVSRVGLGTWAIGGWMWGGTDETESIKTIHAAPHRGIPRIQTAPVHSFGRFAR